MTIFRPPGRLLLLQHSLRPQPHFLHPLPILHHHRHYAPKPSARRPNHGRSSTLQTTPTPPLDPVQSALHTIQGHLPLDPLNPPLSTLPPPLTLPTRGPENFPTYLFRLGRAYATFYKSGVKAVYYNHRAAQLLRTRLQTSYQIRDIAVAVQKGLLKRSEFQLLERSGRDVGKVPFFAVLVLLLGEWLPLVVPFMPGVVPGTCRIPKQVEGMRGKAEGRRRASFRSGVPEPSVREENDGHAEASGAVDRNDFLRRLRADQLLHLSTTLNLHGNIWTRLQLPPPTFLLRPRIARRLAYLAHDDGLLAAHAPHAVAKLSLDELRVACEERGMDVLGRQEEGLRKGLGVWVRLQGRGETGTLTELLFRRPNVWGDLEKQVKLRK